MASRKSAASNPPAPRSTRPVRTMYLIKRAQHETYLRLESLMQPLGVSAAQYMLMDMLEQRDGLSSAQISRRFAVSPQTMIKQIATLESRGLISRQTTDANKRALLIRLTDEGRSLLDACNAAVDMLEASMFSDLGEKNVEKLRATLTQLLGFLAH